MKWSRILIAVVVSVVLTSCSAVGMGQPPAPSVYEYQYEILNTREACEPTSREWTRLEMVATLGESYSEEILEIIRGISSCNANWVQEKLSQRGADGWELITFEAMKPGEYDLGFEFTYRAVWKRPQK